MNSPSKNGPDAASKDIASSVPGNLQDFTHEAGWRDGQMVSMGQDRVSGDWLLLHELAIDAQASQEARDSVLEAARAAAPFRHPAVLPVRGVEPDAGGIVFIQENPQGRPLAQVVGEGGPIPCLEALAWLRNFVDGLGKALDAGLLLPQISPVDFAVREKTTESSRRSLICLCPPVPDGWWLEMNDPVFASPEQKAGQPCGIRAAMYSTGALFAWMVLGQSPPEGDSWEHFVSQSSLPQRIKNLLTAVLSVEPDQRTSSPITWLALMDRSADGDANKPRAKSSLRVPTPVADTNTPAATKARPTPALTATRGGVAPIAPASVSSPSAPEKLMPKFMTPPAPVRRKRGKLPWLPITVGLAVLIGGIWFFTRPHGGKTVATTNGANSSGGAQSSPSDAPKTVASSSATGKSTAPDAEPKPVIVPAPPASQPEPNVADTAPKAEAPPVSPTPEPSPTPAPTIVTPLPASGTPMVAKNDAPTPGAATESSVPVPSPAPAEGAPSTSPNPPTLPPPPTVAEASPLPKTEATSPSGTLPMPPAPVEPTVPPATPPPVASAPTPADSASTPPATPPSAPPAPMVASNTPSSSSLPVPPPPSLPVESSTPVTPAPPTPPAPVPAPEPPAPPAPANSETLLAQARNAPKAERVSLYRDVLKSSPENQDALRALVADAMESSPVAGDNAGEVRGWATTLSNAKDPVGDHALGLLDLQHAKQGASATDSAKELVEAIAHLEAAAHAGHLESYAVLMEAYIELHDAQQRSGATGPAAKTRVSLYKVMDNLPKDVPASAPRELAEKLDHDFRDHAGKGRGHLQNTQVQRYMMSQLYRLAAHRGDAVAKKWVSSHS